MCVLPLSMLLLLLGERAALWLCERELELERL